MTSSSENVFVNKLNDIVKKKQYANHKTTKRKLIDVKSNTLINFDVKKN